MSKTPLIVRLPNWVGDVIMTLPSLQALESSGFDLHLVGQKWIMDLLNAFPGKLSSLTNSSWLGMREDIRNIRGEKVLLFTNSLSSAFITWLAGKKSIGYKNNVRNLFLQKKIKKPQTQYCHEVEHFWQIAQLAKQTWLPSACWPEGIPTKINLPVSKISQLKMRERLLIEGINSPFIVLCPQAKGKGKKGSSKIWPFWESLDKILHKHGILTVVCPGPNELALCQRLTPHAKFLPDINLSELAALFKESCLIVANDSGPMHLAAAVGSKILGIFGTTDPQRTAPWGGDYIGSLGKWPAVNEVFIAIEKQIN